MTEEKIVYNHDFKMKAVLLSFERGPITEVARELGIHKTVLYGWRQDYKKFGSNSFPGTGSLRLSADQKKIHELEKKIKDSEIKFKIFKNAGENLFKERSFIFDYIKENEKLYSVMLMCRILTVDRDSYRRWKNKILSEPQKRKNLIKLEITTIFVDSQRRYGSRRIAVKLQQSGYQLSHITVGKYMRELGFSVSVKKNNQRTKHTSTLSKATKLMNVKCEDCEHPK